jgi:cytochrome P450
MTADLYWDPYDKAIDVDPHPLWRRMRDEQPVYRNEKFDETAGMANEIAIAAATKLHLYIAEQIEARRAAPRDDLMTALVQAEVRVADGGTRRLSTREATDFTTLLTAAGTETVARLLGWACDVLAAHPDQRAALAADPSLLAGAVEETLRYEAPSPVQGRVTTRDVERTAPRSRPSPRSCC